MSGIIKAAQNGNIATVKKVIGKGCDVNKKDEVCMFITSDSIKYINIYRYIINPHFY